MNASKFVLTWAFAGSISIVGGNVYAENGTAAVQHPDSQTLGKWTDDLVKCKTSIESHASRYYYVARECRDLGAGDELRTPLIKIDANRFIEDARPRKSWYYLIAASGDLEIRDSEGVVRTLESLKPKTERQVEAQRKSEGVSIGMTMNQVLQSSWGRPLRVNKTVTVNGAREQWVYKSGYLYIYRTALS